MLLYIDPGTGSMLFTILLGIIGTIEYFLKLFYFKAKYNIRGKKDSSENHEKIPYVIFSDDKRYWYTFEAICDYFDAKDLKLEYWTASEDDPALTKEYKTVRCRFIGKSNKAYAKLNNMSATICLSTTPGLNVYQWRRSKNVDWYVHIFHGASQAMQYRMFGLDFYDAVLTTGPLAEKYIRKLEDLRGIPKKEISMCGCTTLDMLLRRKKETIRDIKKSKKCEKTVLLAPTWGKSGILSKFGDSLIDALLKTTFKIIIRPHPQSMISEIQMIEHLKEKYPDGEKIEWNFDVDNFDVLSVADVLISDFSGVLYDFAFIFDKPVIYADTTFDAAPYDIAWMDEPLWILTILEKLGVRLKEEDFDRIGTVMESVMNNDIYAEGRKYVRDQVWAYRGRSAENISEYMIKKYDEIAS